MSATVHRFPTLGVKLAEGSRETMALIDAAHDLLGQHHTAASDLAVAARTLRDQAAAMHLAAVRALGTLDTKDDGPRAPLPLAPSTVDVAHALGKVDACRTALASHVRAMRAAGATDL